MTLPMEKKIADRTPTVEAASVKASCSFIELIDLGSVLLLHSGYAGVRVLEPRLWRGDSSDLRSSRLVSGEA